MTTTIESPANADYNFGLDFDYSVWPKGTQIDLVNVPWNSDYRDVVAPAFGLDAYIDSLNPVGIRTTGMSYLKPGEPISINLPHNVVQRFNYLRVKNPLQPIPGSDVVKNWYYFILDTKYVAPNNTQLILQLDVWSTYIPNVTLGNCYVERGHIGIANENAFNNYGRDYLTVPEGLDLGAEYLVGWEKFQTFIDSWEFGGNIIPKYSIIATSTSDLTADPGTVDSPKLVTAKGSVLSYIFSGAGMYAWETELQFSEWLFENNDKPWMTQNIISINIVPSLDRYFDGIVWPTDGHSPLDVSTYMALAPNILEHTIQPAWRASTMFSEWDTRFANLDKFKVSPYMVIEMTTWTGTPIILKPELWNDPDATVKEMIGLVPPSQRIVSYPQAYNAQNTGISYKDVGEFLDVATLISGLPQVMTVNNSSVAYLANNAHSIAFSYQNADWSQQRALQGAQTAYNIQAQQIETNRAATAVSNANLQGQTGITNALNLNRAPIDALSGVVGGAAGAGVAGGRAAGYGAIAGAVGGTANAFTAGMSADAATQSSALQQNVNKAQTAIGNRQTQYAADSNLHLAQWAAKGDYANQIAGINAKLQDTRMLQPSTSGQIGGDAFNITYGNFGVALKWKWLDKANMARIGNYWLRYGYAINQFMQIPSTLMVMEKFTYWKLAETYISAAGIPEQFKQAIRGMLEKGVTVWANPADIGNIDIADNAPLTGISY